MGWVAGRLISRRIVAALPAQRNPGPGSLYAALRVPETIPVGEWFKVGTNADFVEQKGVAVDAGAERVAVFRVDGRLHALQDHCPHMRASLADGKIEGGQRVICHMHGWTFDLNTGQPEGGRSNCARIYPIET